MSKEWDILLSEFRNLGGIADNVYQKEGELGRGVFSINPSHKSRIFIPSNLMIKKEDIFLDGNQLRIKKDKAYKSQIRDFFNYYQDNFSWGRGGKKKTESFEEGLSIYTSHVKELIKNNFLVDLEERHKGTWENIIKKQFLNARAFKFGEDSVIAPVLELVNHEVNAFPFVKKFNGISTPNYAPRGSELTHVYGYSSSINRVFKYGFFCKEPIVFSLPFNINFKDSKFNFICKGLVLKDDKIKYKITGSQIIIDGMPIAALKKPSFIKSYFEHLLELTNLKDISHDILPMIVNFNYLRRQNILRELQPFDNYSSRIISKAINYELESISHV